MRVELSQTKEFSFASSLLKEPDFVRMVKEGESVYLEFSAISSGITARLKLPANKVEGEEKEVLGLSYRVLKSIGRLSGQVEISTTEKQMRIKNYGSQFRFAKVATEFEAPEFKAKDYKRAFKIEAPAKTLKVAIKICKPFADGSVSQVLDGLKFSVQGNKLEVIATDSKFLSFFEIVVPEGSEEQVEFILDKNATGAFTNAIDLLGSADVYVNDSVIVLTDGDSYIMFPQLHGDYPNAKEIVINPFLNNKQGKDYCEVKVLKEQLDNVVKAIKSVVEEDTQLPVIFEMSTDEKEYITVKRAFFDDPEDLGYVEVELFYEDICEDKDKVITEDMFPIVHIARFITAFKQDSELTLFLPKEDSKVYAEWGARLGIGYIKEGFKGIAVAMALRK